MGQWEQLADELSMQNVDMSSENPAHSRIFNTFITTRDCVREIFGTVNRILSEGLQKKTQRMLVAEDIWQVIRYQIWIDNSVKDDWCIGLREPMQCSDEPLPKIDKI